MKRQAEKQLTKDRDEEEVDENPGQGFQKADESVLAARVIRGLPKRAGATPPVTGRAPGGETNKTAAPSVFSVNPLGGAGAFKLDASSTTSSSTSSPFSGFSFKPTADSSGKPPATNNFFSPPSTSAFAPTPTQTTSSTSNFFTSGTSQPSNTSKTFASLLNSTSPSSGPTTASKSTPPTPSSFATSTTNGAVESVLVKYYTDLRGLNMSLLSSISKGIEKDPFIDISSFLEHYQSLRSKIQKEFDESSTTSKPKSEKSSANLAMPPVPPTSFAGFGAPAKKPTSTPKASEPKPNIFDFKGPGFSPPTTNPFTAAKDATPASSPFGASASAFPAPSSTPTPAAFTFGGSASKLGTGPSPFGTFGGAPPSPFGGSAPALKSVFGSSSSSPFLYGASTEKAPASTNIFGGGDKTPSVFQTAPPAKSVFGTSVFGPKATTQSSVTAEEKPAEGENSESGTPVTEGADPAVASLIAAGPNPHDEEGEGEENEETSHRIKVKAYRLSKADEEGAAAKWVTLGSGILRIKKDKESGARRVLLRNSTNGKVVMNFKIYSALKPTQTKAAISFVGHDAGASHTYSVRLPNEDDAKELKSALEKEIEFIKAKDGS